MISQPSACISAGEGAMRSHSEQPPIRTARPFRFSAERRRSAPERLLETVEAVHMSRIGAITIAS